jgi:hypothetical protein
MKNDVCRDVTPCGSCKNLELLARAIRRNIPDDAILHSEDTSCLERRALPKSDLQRDDATITSLPHNEVTPILTQFSLPHILFVIFRMLFAQLRHLGQQLTPGLKRLERKTNHSRIVDLYIHSPTLLRGTGTLIALPIITCHPLAILSDNLTPWTGLRDLISGTRFHFLSLSPFHIHIHLPELVFIVLNYRCGLVITVRGYNLRGPGFDSRRYQVICVAMGLEWDLLHLD